MTHTHTQEGSGNGDDDDDDDDVVAADADVLIIRSVLHSVNGVGKDLQPNQSRRTLDGVVLLLATRAHIKRWATWMKTRRLHRRRLFRRGSSEQWFCEGQNKTIE